MEKGSFSLSMLRCDEVVVDVGVRRQKPRPSVGDGWNLKQLASIAHSIGLS